MRYRTSIKYGHQSIETAYYMSNGAIQNSHEYFNAIRNHWSVEVYNHIRDVSLQEDQLRTKKNPSPK